MQNFMKTILSAIRAWIKREMNRVENKITASTADWNQNDPNADNYVKNRTHWTDENGVVHKLDKKYLDLPENVATAEDVEKFADSIIENSNNIERVENIAKNNPCWDVNDESSVRYIRDRTHFTTYTGLTKGITSKLDISNEKRSFPWYTAFRYYPDMCRMTSPYYSNATYSLDSKIDDADGNTIYTYISSNRSSSALVITLNDYAKTGEIEAPEVQDNQIVTISFYIPYGTEEVVQLDEKYIPNNIPKISAAKEGQTIVVKSIDENGKPTEWETVDMAGAGGSIDEVYILSDGETLDNVPEGVEIVIDPDGDPDFDFSGFVQKTELQGVIDTALAQAKESGEFDGKDGVVQVTGATVGQTVKISAVDENGVPTAWESEDFPSDEHINSLINTALGVIENGTY